MKVASYVILSALACTALVLSGCRKASEKVSEKVIEKSLRSSGAKDAKVDLSKGKMTVKTDKGVTEVSSGESVSLPADFPKDVFVLKGAKIQMAMKNPQGFMVQMKADQAMSKVAESYSAEMKAQGWTQETSMDTGDMCTRSFKKDQRQATVMVSKSDAASDVMLTITTEK